MKINWRIVIITSIVLAAMTLLFIGLGSALTPLIISFAMAYLCFPLIKRLEARGLPRQYAVIAVFLIISMITVGCLLLIVPLMAEEISYFLKELPDTTVSVLGKVEDLLSSYGISVDFSKENIKEFINKKSNVLSSAAVKNMTLTLGGAFTSIMAIVLYVLNLFLIPLFFFYVINDYEKITKQFFTWFPTETRSVLKKYGQKADVVLSGYIRGQLLVACILSMLYGLGLWLVGLKFGFLIGFLAGLISIIPYAGFVIGISVALLVGFANYDGLSPIIGIICTFTLVQMLEGFVITPNLVGDKVGLSALATILALIIGGNLFGIVGMLIAIPSAAILKNILIELKKQYIH